MEIERIDRLNVQFDKGDIREYNVAGGTFSSSISLTTNDGKVLELKFSDTFELKEFLNNIMTCVMEMDWSRTYPSAWRRTEYEGKIDVESLQIKPTEQTEQPPF